MYWLAKFTSWSDYLYSRSNNYLSLKPLLLIRYITKPNRSYLISWHIRKKIQFAKMFIWADQLQYQIHTGAPYPVGCVILCDSTGETLQWNWNWYDVSAGIKFA